MTAQGRTPESAPAGQPAAARAAAQTVPAALDAIARSQEAVESHVRAGSRPWWFDVPAVAVGCARVAAAPFVAIVRLAEAAVALALVGALGVGLAWHQGYLSDKDVVAALKPVGQRILTMVQTSGAP